MFNVLIITVEPPDCRLIILDNDVEVDHGQGEHRDHGHLHPRLDGHNPGLGNDSRHLDVAVTDVFCLFSLSFDEFKIGKLWATSYDSLDTLH